jgi:hypothetical protein
LGYRLLDLHVQQAEFRQDIDLEQRLVWSAGGHYFAFPLAPELIDRRASFDPLPRPADGEASRDGQR